MKSYRPLYGNPADIVPPGFEGHDDAWHILATQLNFTPTDVMLPSPSVDLDSLMALIEQLEAHTITEAQFVASVRSLMQSGQIDSAKFTEFPTVLRSISSDIDAIRLIWSIISSSLNLSVADFERLFDTNYTSLLTVIAQKFLLEEITEEQLASEVRKLLQFGELVTLPTGATPGVIPTEFAVSSLDFAWELLAQEGVTIAQWNSYDQRTKDLILAKAVIFMNDVPTESRIQNYLSYCLDKMRSADIALFGQEAIDITTQPEFVGPPAPPEMQLALRGAIETALKFEFPEYPLISTHDIYSFMEDVGLTLQTSGGATFDVPMLQNVIRYFKFLGFPDYRPTELAAIMALVNSGNTNILDAERTAMAIDSNRPDALDQPLNLKIVLAAFGEKAFNTLKKFCAQPLATRANDISEFYENDLHMLLGVDSRDINSFVLESFDARISGQLAVDGENSLAQLEASRAADIAKRPIAEQAAAVRAPTSRTQSFQTSGAKFAEARSNYSKVKASLVIGSFAIGVSALSYHIWHKNKR